MTDKRAQAREMAGDGLSTDWFETLYARAEAGEATVPWADGVANPMLVDWVARRGISGPGRAAVIGSGYGDDAQFVASLGYDVTAFDLSATAVEHARRGFPASAVDYVVADILDPPPTWHQAFDLVVEVYTVQVLQGPMRQKAAQNAAGLVKKGGTLLVLARARDEDEDAGRMPWPLTRAEIAGFAEDGRLREIAVDLMEDGETPPVRRWVAEFRH